MLAGRCSRLLATDVSETAVQQARKRCAGWPNVRIECRDLRADFNDPTDNRPFDLIVFSEVGYYFDIESLATLARRLADALCTNGELIAVHWRGHSSDHLLHGMKCIAACFTRCRCNTGWEITIQGIGSTHGRKYEHRQMGCRSCRAGVQRRTEHRRLH
jgi:hypothetical protein